MKMKKIAACFMSLTMLTLSLASCGNDSSAGEAGANNSGDAKVYKIGIIQQLEHNALDAATKGFEEGLKEKFGDNVNIDYQNAQNEMANCATISTKFVTDNVDLIMANATNALTAAAAATADIPIVGTSITNYESAGVVNDESAPGTNVTGVSDLAPIDQQIELLHRVVPDAKKVSIVYCSAEPNSVYQAELAKSALDELNIESQTFTAADSNEIQAVITKAVDGFDAVYIPTDNVFASNMEIVKNVTVPAKIPVFAGEENMCKSGGLITLSISYEELGKKAADMAYEILVNGKNPAEMPIEYVTDNLTAKYNADIAEQLGIEIPDDIEAIK